MDGREEVLLLIQWSGDDLTQRWHCGFRFDADSSLIKTWHQIILPHDMCLGEIVNRNSII